MERIIKQEQIQNIERETDLHDILMDLLPKMGYTDVTLTHERGNNPEMGKDIVASIIDLIENKKEWTAFVIKKGDVRGTSVGTQEIKAQVEECFTFSWNSISKGKDNKISKVKVVTSGKYNSGATTKILQDSFYNNPNISLWSSVEIVNHIDKYYPRFWLKGNKTYKHYVEIFQEKNKEDDFTKALGINDTKIQKIINLAIKPKFLDLHINEEGETRRKLYDTHEVGKLNESAIIVGESGSGKSTFFKQLANEIIFENALRNDYEYYPFILKFCDFQECDFDVIKLLEQYLNQEGIKEISINLEEILEKRNFVLFIDALDEIGDSEQKEKALEAIQDFRNEFPEIKIYCSSRPGDSLISSCHKQKFKYLEIVGVSIQEAEQFIGRYFNEEQIKCKRLLKSLRDSHILDKLPKTPLTLALITAIFDESEMEIPATISDLYKNFVDLLLNKSFKDSTLDLLKIGIHRSVLSFLGEYMHTNRKRHIDKNELIEILKSFANQRGHKYDVNELLIDLIQNIGLLIENDRGEIEFKHLSFQEYFTAYQFYNHNINGKNNFIENFNDIWWQNVAIFYAGMTKDSPELIKEILEKSEPKNFNEYVINLSGIGYLMQALYNTPIESRIAGLKRNVINAKKSVEFLINTKEQEFEIYQNLFNTRYGVYKVISYWYEFHHTSITLQEPLIKLFEELSKKITNIETSKEERNEAEYSAYLVASTLSDINDYEFKYLKELITITDSKNYFVIGLIDSNFNQHYKRLSKENKRRKEVKKFGQRLELIDRKKINDNVNIRLIDGKKIIQKPKR
jgi:energy-coupling factor transporter ATP-binding protein EcfA2